MGDLTFFFIGILSLKFNMFDGTAHYHIDYDYFDSQAGDIF